MVEADGAVEVLEAMEAQVAELAPVEKRHGRGRAHDLAAVGERTDSGSAVHVDADVTLPGDGRRPRVQSHANGDRSGSELVLRGARGVGGAARGRKRDEEGVALCVDLDTTVRSEGASQESSMIRERVCVRIRAERVQQSRRSLDVGEEKRDGAGREVPAHGRVIDGVVASRASE